LHYIKFQEALSELKRFSVVKHTFKIDGQEVLVIHRLVQAVVKDQMTERDVKQFRSMIIKICFQAFLQERNGTMQALCRVYISQVLGPLMGPEASMTEEFANVVDCVGQFL